MKNFFKNISRKLALLLTVMVFSTTLPGNIQKAVAATLSLSDLQSKYPNGSTWNDSYENKAWECHGFVCMLAKALTGTDPYSWTKYYNLNSLKSGDIIRCSRPHSILVTSVSGDTITYVDCNWVGKNKVKWGQTITKSQITRKFGKLSYVMSSPVSTDSHNPIGAIDSIQVENGRIRVIGWALDGDDYSKTIYVDIYIGGPAGSGAPGYRIRADKNRLDVGRAISGAGEYHGFDEWLETDCSGNQAIYVYFINIKEGDNTLIGSRNISIPKKSKTPSGELDKAFGASGKIYICGWGLDEDDWGKNAKIHIYIGRNAGEGGRCYAVLTANKNRIDVGLAKPGAGNYHGFEDWVSTDLRGRQTVYAYVIGSGGINKLLTPREVFITD